MRPPIPLFVRRACAAAPRRVPFAVAVAIAAALAATAAVHAAEGPRLPIADIVPDAPARPPAPPDDPAVQARLPGCAVWTDRCVTCERAAGRISCSNIGITCQPQAVECVRSETAEEKKAEEKKSGN
jgi:hypothetical protein